MCLRARDDGVVVRSGPGSAPPLALSVQCRGPVPTDLGQHLMKGRAAAFQPLDVPPTPRGPQRGRDPRPSRLVRRPRAFLLPEADDAMDGRELIGCPPNGSSRRRRDER